MAKKVRRARRVARRARPNGDNVSAKDQPKQTVEEELREEYAYVAQDLRRVALLAAAMFILLIALNLLLR